MASVKGVNITNLDATPPVVPEANEWHGRLRVQQDSYEASSLASGSDITVARLPKGARVHEIVVMADALGSGVTIAVGDGDSSARFIAATAMNTANKAIKLSADGKIAGIGHKYTSETDLLLTTGGAAATGTIKAQVFYAVD